MLENSKSSFIIAFSLLIMAIGLFYFPVVMIMFLFAINSYVFSKYKIYPLLISISILIFIFQYTLNLNGIEVGDIARYYELLNNGYNNSFLRFNLYQAYFFQYIEDNNLMQNIYGAISVSATFLIYSFTSVRFLKLFGYCITTRIDWLLFLFLLVSLIPFTVFYSFANALSFAFIYLFIYFYIKSRYVGAILSSTLALLIHNASTVPFLIYFFSKFKFILKHKFLSLIITTSLVSFVLSFTNSIASMDIPYISMIFKKVISYLVINNEVSLVNTIYNILNLAFFSYIYIHHERNIKFKNKKFILYHNFIFSYILVCIPFVLSSTIGGRYLQLGVMFFLPYIYACFKSYKLNSKKVIALYVFLFISLFSYSNLYFISSLRHLSFGDEELLIYSLKDIFYYEVNQ
ncbi:hypothetical protein Q4601_00720 [Shewanella sp. 1_MG-2023]|uniref:hypothetical protein n=1 Tax=unclassified Shewanella TaxID=196818 RepID=UPI0026E31198|nr:MULTISPECIES: hypothetical protein [unclassified Shewanella]MDO6610111.1 hypothetical protein [Shewanella sp. 7_MG-2023]MDO6769747.1 hypothetical protein [Shewanella sp. 2_MG-2023]MDO6792811.1 hypothetical protein [Shewanella sp. 1_MG-2023]